MQMIKIYLSIMIMCSFLVYVFGQPNKEAKYEFKIPGVDLFERIDGLPDPFLKINGDRIKSIHQWEEQREYIKEMLAFYQYGPMPPLPDKVVVNEILSEEVYNGKGIRKHFILTMERNNNSLALRFGLIMPNNDDGPFSIIIKNDRTINDIPDAINLEAINRNYIMCQFIRTDLASDFRGMKKREENHNNGAFLLYPEYDWGTIAIWAWGYKLLIDYFENQPYIDKNKIVVTGHSRGGKTALCAGVYDERIAITAPNSSGLGGTASHRYFEFGMLEQTIGMHVNSHAHWWASKYYELAGFETMVPFDAHFAMATIAPRGMFNAHALQDYHANPFGTHLTFESAKKVYKWLGAEDNIAMHWRTGGHAQGVEDWFALLDFCDKYFYNIEVDSRFDINPYPNTIIPAFWEAPEVD